MLDRLAGFRPYSAPNVLLMLAQALAQAPKATRVAGCRKWREMACCPLPSVFGISRTDPIEGFDHPLTTEPKIEGMSSRWPIVRWTPPPVDRGTSGCRRGGPGGPAKSVMQKCNAKVAYYGYEQERQGTGVQRHGSAPF